MEQQSFKKNACAFPSRVYIMNHKRYALKVHSSLNCSFIMSVLKKKPT